MSFSRCVARLSLLVFLALAAGCATYTGKIGEMEQQLAAGNPAAALAFLERMETPARDRVLFLLDKAMLQRQIGDYAGSNATFEAAKKLMEALSTTSAMETAGTFIINDATRSYVGEPFEQALLHAYAALNYLDLKSLDEARVEALQVEARLKQLAQKDDGALAKDPFARYLAGMIYEAEGESSDALISYRMALEGYRAHAQLYGATIPEALKRDMLRMTERVGIKDEHRKLAKEFDGTTWAARGEYAEKGELIFFLHNGMAPMKRESTVVIYPPRAEQIVSIALPHYQPRTNPVVRARLTLAEAQAETEVVEDVNAIAKATLDDALPMITVRAIARAVAKYKMTAKARKEGGAAAGLITNLANVLTERADTRNWLTLPAEIQMARMLAPPGDYKLRLELVGSGGALTARELDVHLEPGKKTFLSYSWFPGSGGKRQ